MATSEREGRPAGGRSRSRGRPNVMDHPDSATAEVALLVSLALEKGALQERHASLQAAIHEQKHIRKYFVPGFMNTVPLRKMRAEIADTMNEVATEVDFLADRIVLRIHGFASQVSLRDLHRPGRRSEVRPSSPDRRCRHRNVSEDHPAAGL